jgi:hypothetical protein
MVVYLLEKDLNNVLIPSERAIINLNRRPQKVKQEWQKSPAGARQKVGKSLVWFGEIERKLAKLPKTTFTYCSSS